MKLIGLAMIHAENDILPETLPRNAKWLDALYILDGDGAAFSICETVGFDGYTTDADLPRPPYPAATTDGCRQHLLSQATAAHGSGNLFALIHGDELWTADPRETAVTDHDGWMFPLPCYFPREPWDDSRTPLAQLHWSLRPGYPEFRLFRGPAEYAKDQHFNVVPSGVNRIGRSEHSILHFPFRSPDSQRARAVASFDPGNYGHVRQGVDLVWGDDRIEHERRHAHYSNLVEGPA